MVDPLKKISIKSLRVDFDCRYSASNGTVVSADALTDPFNSRMTIDDRFIFTRYLDHVITDSHFAARYV